MVTAKQAPAETRKSSVVQHPLEIPKGCSTNGRQILVTKPSGSTLGTFNATNRKGEPVKTGRVNAFDVETGQYVNYMTGRNSKGVKIGRILKDRNGKSRKDKDGNPLHSGEIFGVEQSESYIKALEDALNGPDAILYKTSETSNGIKAVIVEADVDLGGAGKDGREDRPHLINRVPEGGLRTSAPTPEQVHTIYSTAAKYKYAEKLAGRAHNEFVHDHEGDAKGARKAADLIKATYLGKRGLPFINMPAGKDVKTAYEGHIDQLDPSDPAVAAALAADDKTYQAEAAAGLAGQDNNAQLQAQRAAKAEKAKAKEAEAAAKADKPKAAAPKANVRRSVAQAIADEAPKDEAKDAGAEPSL